MVLIYPKICHVDLALLRLSESFGYILIRVLRRLYKFSLTGRNTSRQVFRQYPKSFETFLPLKYTFSDIRRFRLEIRKSVTSLHKTYPFYKYLGLRLQ